MNKIIKKILCEIGENNIRFGQDGKSGTWYCKEISLNCKDIFDGLQVMDAGIVVVEEILKEKNKGKTE